MKRLRPWLRFETLEHRHMLAGDILPVAIDVARTDVAVGNQSAEIAQIESENAPITAAASVAPPTSDAAGNELFAAETPSIISSEDDDELLVQIPTPLQPQPPQDRPRDEPFGFPIDEVDRLLPTAFSVPNAPPSRPTDAFRFAPISTGETDPDDLELNDEDAKKNGRIAPSPILDDREPSESIPR